MNIPIFITMLFTLQLFYWIVGRRASKNIGGKEDYFLAGKNVRLFPLMMSFLAALVGGGVVLGAAEEAYRFGWAVLLYPFGAALGLIVLGLGVGRRLAGFQVPTIAAIFEVVYESKRLRQAASILSIVTLFMILVAQIIASNKFLVGLGISSPPLFVLFWAFVIFYTAQGGLRAVIATDIVQAALFTIVFIACFLFVVFSNPEGVFVEHPGTISAVSSKLSGWLLMPLLFIVTEQDMGQRCFAGGSPQIISRATFIAGGIMMVICIVPVYFGVLARALNIEIPLGGSVLMAAIVATTSPWIATFVGCAILAAVISTASSLINSISSNIFSDFTEISNIAIVRKITMAISFGAIFSAFFFDNIIDILVQSFELSISCLFVPIAFALFNKKGRFLAALFAFACGGFGFILFRLVPQPIPGEILSIFLSFAGYGFGWMVESRKKIENSLIEEIQ